MGRADSCSLAPLQPNHPEYDMLLLVSRYLFKALLPIKGPGKAQGVQLGYSK